MIDLKINTRNLKTVFAIKDANTFLLRAIKEGMKQQADVLTKFVHQRYFASRTTQTKLSDPLGVLRHAIAARRVIVTESGDEYRYSAGIDFSAIPYAKLHVGRKGRTTTIRPKNSQFLAVPLQAARNRGWNSSTVSPLDVTKKDFLTFRKSDSGDGILVSPSGVPYYVLKKSVKVHTRIHPEEIIRLMKPTIAQNMERIIKKAKAAYRKIGGK